MTRPTKTFTRRKPRPLSEERLRQAAFYYLQRFAATEASLVRVLEGKIKRALGPDADREELAQWGEVARKVAQSCLELGLVDDRSYARARARRLHRQGKPLQRIGGMLAEKGVGAADVDHALEALAEECGPALDLRAAIVFARRRRLGPFARERSDDPDLRRKALAAFGRAGFPYNLAVQVLDADDVSVLDELVAAAEE